MSQPPCRQHPPLGCHHCHPAPRLHPKVTPRVPEHPAGTRAGTEMGERACLLAGSPAGTHGATKPPAPVLAARQLPEHRGTSRALARGRHSTRKATRRSPRGYFPGL